ncbi:hypothetical protein D3C76_749000 [compost metagenome]
MNDNIGCKIFQKLFFVTGLALAGCATKPPPQVQYVRVEVPVQVPCRVPIIIPPVWATAGLQPAYDLEVKVRALLAERLQRIGYERILVAALNSCSDNNNLKLKELNS